jgi:hypothetical protein
MIPEELVILNGLSEKHNIQASISKPLELYLLENKDDMQTVELGKVYLSCLTSKIDFTESFKNEMQGILLQARLPKCDA